MEKQQTTLLQYLREPVKPPLYETVKSTCNHLPHNQKKFYFNIALNSPLSILTISIIFHNFAI
jgi:hypothetical protein